MLPDFSEKEPRGVVAAIPWGSILGRCSVQSVRDCKQSGPDEEVCTLFGSFGQPCKSHPAPAALITDICVHPRTWPSTEFWLTSASVTPWPSFYLNTSCFCSIRKHGVDNYNKRPAWEEGRKAHTLILPLGCGPFSELCTSTLQAARNASVKALDRLLLPVSKILL